MQEEKTDNINRRKWEIGSQQKEEITAEGEEDGSVTAEGADDPITVEGADDPITTEEAGDASITAERAGGPLTVEGRGDGQ